MILSAQSIAERCYGERPMIVGFTDQKRVVNGKSAGLSACTYDLCVSEDIVLGAHPGFLLAQHVMTHGFTQADLIQERLSNTPAPFSLAYTVEDFDMPDDVAALILDKSSYARVFVSAMNTFMDPGFSGPPERNHAANLTLEMVNLGDELVEIRAGDPICQIAFFLLDVPTDRPYSGKYSGQTKGAHRARHELADGSFIIKPSKQSTLPAVVSPAGA